MTNRGAYLYRRERKKRSHKLSERLNETENQEPRRRARSGGSRATSATTGSSEDGSSGQHADYDTEVLFVYIYPNICNKFIYIISDRNIYFHC